MISSILLALPVTALGQTPVPVQDPGFEVPVQAQCGFVPVIGIGTHPSWQPTSPGVDVGVWAPAPCWDVTAPQGLQVMYSNGGGARQVLGTIAQPGQTYSLSVRIGARNNPCCPFSPATISLLAGSTVIASRTVGAADAPPAGQWATFTTSGALALGGTPAPIEVRLENTGAQTDYDDVRVFIGQISTNCPADIGSTGGAPGQDGVLNNNDFVVFIDYFFSSNPIADRGSTGGTPGPDGLYNNNDFVVFIDQFFAGC